MHKQHKRSKTTTVRLGLAAAAALLVATGFAMPAWSGVDVMSDQELVQQSELILGLDGAAYQPYKDSVIIWVQDELRRRDLYEGPTHGKLDEGTMQAIAEFQRGHGLHASGIPSPFTREALLEPSPVATANATAPDPTIPAS